MQRYRALLLLPLFYSICASAALVFAIYSTANAQIEIERDISTDPSAERTTAEENTGYFSDENLLIVEIFLERNGTGENIEIFQHEGGFFVPLGYLTRMLEFPIKVKAATGEAQGWFIRENRIFDLNLARSEVIVEGKRESFDPALAQFYYGDIYVEQSLFAKWFPIDLELNFSNLVVRLKPRETLPIQARLERENARSRIRAISGEEILLDPIENPYRLYSEPFLGLDIGYEYASNIEDAGGHNTPYAIRMSNDLGYSNMQFFMSGGIRDGIQGLRTSFDRKDYKGDMLGSLGASQIKFGDINAVAIPTVSRSSQGRGIMISNQDIQRNSKFDSRDFIGDAIPGWDAELYRNGVLLQSIIVPDSGRYEFIDIPVLFGNNSFRLVFYGPQGEIREEVEDYVIDDSFAKKGELFYDVALDQKGKTLFGVEERDREFQFEQDMRLTSSMLYGLTKSTTLTGGLVSTPIEDGTRHRYVQAGIRQSFGGVLANINTAFDLEEGSVLQMIMATSIKDISIRAEHQFLDDFVSEVESATQQRRDRFSALDIDGALNMGLPINYNLGAEHEVFANSDRTATSLNNRLSTTLKGLLFANQIDWRQNKSGGTSSFNTTGSFSIRGRFLETLIRPSVNYTLRPEKELNNVSISVQRNLTRTLNIRGDIRKDLGDSRLTNISSSITKDFETYRLGTNMQADDDGNYTLGMNVSFSFGREPRSGDPYFSRRNITNSGAVSARAFLDKNLNQTFDGDDEWLPETGFKVGNRGYDPKLDETTLFIPHMQSDVPQNIRVDQSTVIDPFWVPQPEGYSVIPRPGVSQIIDFPVVVTTEIDGEVFLMDGGDTRRLSGVNVELVDQKTGEIVQTQRSEYDGFYLFQKVTVGDYILRIKQDDLVYYDAVEDYRIEVAIPQGSDIVSHQNLFIRQSFADEDADNEESEQEATEGETSTETIEAPLQTVLPDKI